MATPSEGQASSGKVAPHRGQLMMMLGILSLFVAPLILAPITWLMARNDLKEMDEGRMDSAGRPETSTGRLCAMISTLTWPLVVCCCCSAMIGQQLMVGGRFLSAFNSRRITQQEFDRIDFGMTKQQVRNILGPPAKTDISSNDRPNWHWYEKNGPAEFNIDFNKDDRVAGKGVWTPD